MTYLSFLAVFLVVPLAGVSLFVVFRLRREPLTRTRVRRISWTVLAHVGLAVAYTTPWDNYLVATRVWWYDPARVLGLTLGWVPLEEYLFFVLQTYLTSAVLLLALRGIRAEAAPPPVWFKPALLGIGASLWGAAILVLTAGWKAGTYLALELAWALPPLLLQGLLGGDVLWKYRASVAGVILGMTLYLAAADTLAIGQGIWTIDPAQSLPLRLAGVLPLEEAVFFALTNALVVVGVTLSLAPEMGQRWSRWKSSRSTTAALPG